MKKLATAFGFIVVGSLSAVAADLPTRQAPAVIPPPPPPMWTGPFVGLFGGGSFGDDPGNGTGGDKVLYCVGGGCIDRPTGYGAYGGAGAVSSSSSNSSSFAFGAQLGYNLQVSPSFLIGGVVDFTWLNRKSSRYVEGALIDIGVYEEQSFYRDTFQQNWLATARLKAGFTFDNLLIYATGGLAWGNLKSRSSTETYWYDSPGGQNLPTELVATGYGSSSGNAVGWAAGAGLEYKFTPNWSLFGEWLYYSLDGSYNVTVNPVPNQIQFSPQTYRVKVDGSGHLVKVGLNYHFWSQPAPVATYVQPVISVRN
jgi:outer membrane immunogenic protein